MTITPCPHQPERKWGVRPRCCGRSPTAPLGGDLQSGLSAGVRRPALNKWNGRSTSLVWSRSRCCFSQRGGFSNAFSVESSCGYLRLNVESRW